MHAQSKKQQFLLTIIIISAATVLSACSPTSSTSDPNLSAQGESTVSNQTSEESMNKNSEAVKTIEDFEPIPAESVVLNTSKGAITLELYRDKAPLTTLNFLSLAKEGFYDGIVFHRVIAGFMAQAGDPLTKDPSQQAFWGTGGPGYTIADEFDTSLTHSEKGILSMANRGPDTGGSQFFITFGPTPHLDGVHSVFGKVTDGMDVLDAIEQGDTIESISIQ